MEYFVADTYKNWSYDAAKAYEKSGKLYVQAKTKCDRCTKGVYAVGVNNGHIVPHPVANGVCFKCGGTGYITKEVRLYDEKEKTALDKQAERRKEKKEAETEARKADLAAHSEENMKKWWSKNGIGEDGSIYCITGDTYAIKDKLKELGCRFSPILKWYSPIPLDLPEDYPIIKFDFFELYEWQPQMKTAFLFENAKMKIEKKIAELQGPSLSEYVGTVGDRLRNITARYDSSHGFMGSFGWTYIHTFYCGDNCLVWMTSKELELEKGAVVDLTGTIVKHEEYRNVKTTRINRCIIKPLE